MTTHIEFECGGGVILTDQSAMEAIADHVAGCPDCPDERTAHEKHLDDQWRAAWEAKIDAALARMRRDHA